jgi:site-specific DNA-methyltransferase (adenine-specific)
MIYSAKKPPLTHNRYEQSFEYMFILSKGKPKTFNPLLRENLSFGKRKYFASTSASTREPGSSQGGKQGKTYTARNRTSIKGNIWHYNVGANCSTLDKIAFQHPAIFPDQLASDHILSWSNEGDMVLDPFMGSGTTGKMALLHNRKFIGIELSQEYVNIAKARIKP